jgi:predicted PurR-regulated permease PerM
MNTSRPRWSSQTKLVVLLLGIGLVIYLLTRFSTVIPPLILAFILAYILNPIVNFFRDRLRFHRTLTIILVYILLIAMGVAIPVIIIPPLAEEIAGLNLDVQRILVQAENFFGHQYVIAGQVIDGAALFDQAVNMVRDFLQPVFSQTLGFVFELISSIVWIVFIMVISFYLVKDERALSEWLDELPPPAYRQDFIRLRQEISQIWSAFFRGQLTLALVVALIFTVFGFVVGLPFALAMAIFAGLLEFLPSIGHTIWLVAASVLAFFLGSTWLPVPNWVFVLIIIGLHLIFQQFDINYLIPRIIGRRVHLPPLVVILGLFAGAAMAGVLGIVLASPTIASARVLGRYVYANLFDLDPVPVPAASPLPPPDSRWWAIRRSRDTEEGEKVETP